MGAGRRPAEASAAEETDKPSSEADKKGEDVGEEEKGQMGDGGRCVGWMVCFMSGRMKEDGKEEPGEERHAMDIMEGGTVCTPSLSSSPPASRNERLGVLPEPGADARYESAN
ncbi:hypothetical protein EYF80_049199 [Liparis tanakae]|uniref:Uncharacterized protein n=1 Tax=Liparis tanakae TaxID=230148 RepID=A0A4Z2FHE0_9TELE|nr:hypothetical protein EYF80_049199 [Liparis tanakae]